MCYVYNQWYDISCATPYEVKRLIFTVMCSQDNIKYSRCSGCKYKIFSF